MAHNEADALGDGLPGAAVEAETPVSSLAEQARAVLSRFRVALDRAVLSVCKGLKGSRDLHNVLAVDRNISWQAYKILGPSDALSTLPYVPAAASMAKLRDALKGQRVAAGIVTELMAAFAAFEELVRTTAGERDRFETMVLSQTDSAEARQADVHHRRSAFKAYSHFFGVQVDAVVNTFIFSPVGDGRAYDCVALLKLDRLRRMRLDTDVAIHGVRYTDDANAAVRAFDTFDEPAAKFFGAPLIPEFCTQPVPPLKTVTEPSGMVRTFLANREVGVGKEIDLSMGRIYRNVSIDKDASGRDNFCGIVEVTRPTQLLVVDMVVHSAHPLFLDHRLATYANAPADVPSLQLERDGVRLPLRDEFARVGRGLDRVRIREIPGYQELLEHAATKMGWSVEDLEVYRVRVDYPLMDTTLVLRLSAAANE